MASRRDWRWVLREADMLEVASYAFGVVEVSADFHIRAALRARANVDFEYALEQFCPAVIFDFLLVDGYRVKALAGWRIQDN